MPTPASGVTIRPELGQGYMELDLMAQAQGYVWPSIFPLISSEREAGTYPVVKLESLLSKVTLDDLRRGSAGSYTRDTWEYESDTFTTVEYGKEEPLDAREVAILGNHGLEAEQIAADRQVAFLLRALESKVAQTVQDTTTYSGQLTNVATAWTDETNATPIKDVKGAIESFEDANGMSPNVLAMSLKQARNALLTDDVKQVLGYRPSEALASEVLQGNALDTMRLGTILAAVFGVERVAISNGFKNSALPGASASLSRIWSDSEVCLLRAGMSGDLRDPTFGRVFAWVGEGGAGAPILVEEYEEPKIRSTVLRARMDLDVKVVHSDLLWILGSVG